MRRGSTRKRLPRGRGGLRINPALLLLASFLVLSVPTILYLYIPFNSPSIYELTASHFTPIPRAPEPYLKVTSSDSSLSAIVNASVSGPSHVYLENTGFSELRRVEVLGNGKALGILSRLVPGEKKVLAMNIYPKEIKVKALDTSGKEIWGEVKYKLSPSFKGSSAQISQKSKLGTQSAQNVPTKFSSISTKEIQESITGQRSGYPSLGITLASNKSEGYEGDVVCYECTAVNGGQEQISDVKLICDGKATSASVLMPDKKLSLNGTTRIQDNVRIDASVQGIDLHGNLITNNTSMKIWKISPRIKLEASGIQQLHRGENASFSVKIENTGNSNLTNLIVSDRFGQIGKIPLLPPSAYQIMQVNRKIEDSFLDEFRVIALDAIGHEVSASQNLDIRVFKTGVEINAQPMEIKAHSDKPANITWIITNTGEETLKNLTLYEDDNKWTLGTLKELLSGKSMQVAATYSKNSTSLINVTVRGYDTIGNEIASKGRALIKIIKPSINLTVKPPEIEVCPGESANLSCLINNSGDDLLEDVVLSQNGSILASIGTLAPGMLRIVDLSIAIPSNTTLQFLVQGKDTADQIWSDCASVKAAIVVSNLKVFASTSPPFVVPGDSTKFTSTVANTGNVPIYNISVTSKKFGQIGSISYLPPKRQEMLSAEKIVSNEANDLIVAEGFTQERKPLRGSFALHIADLKLPGMKIKNKIQKSSNIPQESKQGIGDADLDSSNLSISMTPLSNKEKDPPASQEVESAKVDPDNQILGGISNLMIYVEKALGKISYGAESSYSQDLPTEQRENISASRNYELSIAGIRGSEYGAIRILDVSASPSQPAAWAPVRISVHIKSPIGIKSAKVKWGLSDAPITKQDMPNVNRVSESPLKLESGDSKDGYWSCTIPGNAAGIYMVLSVWLTDGARTVEDGPYMLHWSTVNSVIRSTQKEVGPTSKRDGMLFIESSTVKGKGEISIKDNFHGSAMNFNENMRGDGSISLESMRCIERKNFADNFTERKDLVFTDGQLKGHQTVESPTFEGGLGASVTERFNVNHVDKSEESMVSSSRFGNNTLAFDTDQAFDGSWNIQTQSAQFFKKIKADQEYKGSFQTQKNIKFQDGGRS